VLEVSNKAVSDIVVGPAWRRRGLAAALSRLIVTETGKKVRACPGCRARPATSFRHRGKALTVNQGQTGSYIDPYLVVNPELVATITRLLDGRP
jgi:hypothetical protein